ncbi:Rho guanine nucleotide exchange factor 12 [Eumeta japonica]|uniref:Rho guanine nucleotide exchange factor 12 n=1 Tax=Eumeta variegata TaxID=151549 RepID=A0A4C1ZGJ7_EUMVA|nr:Rho guanine nucleotide exchange factor 12 [Eumeta japonica]
MDTGKTTRRRRGSSTTYGLPDLEAGAGGAAPSGSSSSSSLSSRSNESNTAAPSHQGAASRLYAVSVISRRSSRCVLELQPAWQSEWSEEEEPLAAAWADTVPAHVFDALDLSPRHRKRQEVIHELIVSEGSHVRWLRVLGCVFLRPLERGEHAHLLTPDELRALFPNLPQVLERHMRLYTSLKQLRVGPSAEHAVRLRPLADVVLQTLGEPGYAVCVSRFCRGQRMALEALRERRRKNKELHQFLAAREQDPLCGRLQLRDLIACVWQRLTKYQLLLENILRTVMDEDEDSEEDVARMRLALDTAKEVLHSVDTAIRTAENDHRLRTIQNKLEVRVGSSGGGEFEELRRFELTRHSLRMEGDLMIRTDTNKRVPVLALMLEDCLVLLQREGDRFLLKPIPQPSQSGLLSPIVRWSTVLFRPNAAVRNAFFLMNLNGVQMHELSANTPAEYSMWCKYIQEAPLADARTGSHHAPVRAHDDNSSVSVTRNPSDASERSGSVPRESADAPPAERPESAAADAPPPAPASPAPPAEPTAPAPPTPEVEKKQIPRRPTVGRISTHGPELTAPLEPSAALTVHPPAAHARAHTASLALTSQERLRRLDAAVGRALRAKSQLVGELLAVPSDARAASAVAELAVADALGQLDVNREMRLTAADGFEETEGADSDNEAPDVHQLLLAAQAQGTALRYTGCANYLTMALTRALSVSEADVVSARGGARGVCDSCARRRTLRRSSTLNADDVAASSFPPATTPPVPSQKSTTITEAVNTSVEVPPQTPQADAELNGSTLSSTSPASAWTVLPAEDEHDPGAELSYDTLPELGHDDLALGSDDGDDTAAEPVLGCGSLGDVGEGGGAAVLASRLVGAACGLQATLGRLLAALPALDAHARVARANLAHERDANDALRARLLHERASRDSSEPPDADGDMQVRLYLFS